MDGGTNILGEVITVPTVGMTNVGLIRTVSKLAEQYFDRWFFECELKDEWCDPDHDDFAYELGLLIDEENPAQNTALVEAFAYAFSIHVEHNGRTRRRSNQAFRVTSY